MNELLFKKNKQTTKLHNKTKSDSESVEMFSDWVDRETKNVRTCCIKLFYLAPFNK